MQIYEVLRRPLITEKSTALLSQNKYAFEVDRRANKQQIKEAVEKAFKVKVDKVAVITMPAKAKGFGRLRGERRPWKKAIVTLKEGERIKEFFETT